MDLYCKTTSEILPEMSDRYNKNYGNTLSLSEWEYKISSVYRLERVLQAQSFNRLMIK